MRSNALARTLVSAAAVIGLAAGGLATAGTSFAASAPGAGAQSASILATQNFGLSSQQAKNVQCFMRGAPASYTGGIDGQLGTNSWKAMQRHLKAYWNYTDSIDGDPGPNTVKALQRMLAFGWGYTDRIDGDPGTNTRAAFKRFANDMSVFYPCS
ncbi:MULTISPECIES: peptidoglycan-binding domain-containing protein [unclassified Streptomyces]|uniref:peptidoglycan-binding domain-containing protein n=1 Tax=unclassified Streptomyces TaxID=2593676 RepID=UPI00225AFE19|nr:MULTISPECIES: peptidoglycan-binding protein [unclassified Streptomyces]MCX5050147.1 peptidoglycan-binding protein [Streptomyces sp. NBC_00474]MCX5060540.1 peptidoglycan-binding protein [Streptomyces sp. NBC_00452]MCX5248076.1 peptidoglycan-binding protein [Streptomyces sp. NBC_00201]MCX5293868.1 peptidoglycan-binding protein [Streptomyces sp. NBC_00183]